MPIEDFFTGAVLVFALWAVVIAVGIWMSFDEPVAVPSSSVVQKESP